MPLNALRTFLLVSMACLLARCTQVSPDQWAAAYHSIGIARLQPDINIEQLSPINMGWSVATTDGGFNVRDTLSLRAQRKIYEALDQKLSRYLPVTEPLLGTPGFLGAFPGWPNYTVAAAQQKQSADLWVSVTGQLKASTMEVPVNGIVIQRQIPVWKLTLEVRTPEDKIIYRKSTTAKGDPQLGGSIQVGDWNLGKGMIVREREVLDVFTAALDRLL